MKNTRREVPADAPAFDPDRSDYPLGGAKTGPIWRAAWSVLVDETEHVSGADLVDDVIERVPDAHPETVRQILRRAVVAGILESEIRLAQGRNRAHFRIKV